MYSKKSVGPRMEKTSHPEPPKAIYPRKEEVKPNT